METMQTSPWPQPTDEFGRPLILNSKAVPGSHKTEPKLLSSMEMHFFLNFVLFLKGLHPTPT